MLKLSSLELSTWLQEEGVDLTYCEIFEGRYHNLLWHDPVSLYCLLLDNEIDGPAFIELTENDIKTMIKPLGVVKKILRLQKSVVRLKLALPNLLNKAH